MFVGNSCAAIISDDFEPADWAFGNVYLPSNAYRYVQAMIIGENNVPIMNPDDLCAGYLTIPLEVTKCLQNATEFYKDVIIEVTAGDAPITIHLSPNDKFITSRFERAFDMDTKITIEYDGSADDPILYINGNETPIPDIKRKHIE